MINQKGLTLIEVLVSVIILAAGCVYALQALSKAAEAQQAAEARNAVHLFMMSKLAELEMRISPQDPLKGAHGSVQDKGRPFQWSLSSMPSLLLRQPEAGAEESILLERVIAMNWRHGRYPGEIRIHTLSRASIPEGG